MQNFADPQFSYIYLRPKSECFSIMVNNVFISEKKKLKNKTRNIYFIFKYNHFSEGLTFCKRAFNDWNSLILFWRKVTLKIK